MDDFALLSRHLKEMTWLTRPVVDSVTRQMQEVDWLAQAALANPVRQELEEMNRMSQALVEPVRQELEEMNRMTQALANPVRQELEEMNRMTQALAEPVKLELEKMDQLGGWWAESVAQQISDLQRMFRPLDGLSSALIESARWASSLVDCSPIFSSVAVLGGLPSQWPTGTLSSFRTGGAAQPRVNLGVWARPRPRKVAHSPVRTLSLQCEVVCLICGQEMISEGGELDLTIAGEPITRISVVPWCPHCSRRAAEDPAYEAACYEMLQSLFEDRTLPAYRLLEGGGKSTEPPRGRRLLVLVKTAPPAEGGESDRE